MRLAGNSSLLLCYEHSLIFAHLPAVTRIRLTVIATTPHPQSASGERVRHADRGGVRLVQHSANMFP